MKQTNFDTPPKSHTTSLEKTEFMSFLNKKQSENQIKRNYLIRPGTASVQKQLRSEEPRIFSAQSKNLVPLIPFANNDSWVSSSRFLKDNSYNSGMISGKPQHQRYKFPTTAGGKSDPLQAETLYDELKQLKKGFNLTKEENNRMKTRISNLEKEAVNYQKIIEEIEKNGIVKTPSAAARQNGPDTLVLALKKTIKDLKAQIKQQLEEINFMKKNVKQTHVQELEIERKCFSEENIRLKNILNQNYLNDYSNFIKEQDFANLEQKFYEKNSQFEALMKEKEDLIASLRFSEENNQNFRDSVRISEGTTQKTIKNLKKKLTEKEIEIRYLTSEKSMLLNQTRSMPQQKSQDIDKDLFILNLQKSLEISEKNTQALNEEITQLKNEIDALKADKQGNQAKFLRISSKNTPLKFSAKAPLDEEIEGFFDELRGELILRKVPFKSIESTFFESLRNQLILTKDDIQNLLCIVSPFNIAPGSYLDRLSSFILMNSGTMKLSEILGVLKNGIGDYEIERKIELQQQTLKSIEKKKLAEDLQELYWRNGFLNKRTLEAKLKEHGAFPKKQEIEVLLVEFVEYKKGRVEPNLIDFFNLMKKKIEAKNNNIMSGTIKESSVLTENQSYGEEFEEEIRE